MLLAHLLLCTSMVLVHPEPSAPGRVVGCQELECHPGRRGKIRWFRGSYSELLKEAEDLGYLKLDYDANRGNYKVVLAD